MESPSRSWRFPTPSSNRVGRPSCSSSWGLTRRASLRGSGRRWRRPRPRGCPSKPRNPAARVLYMATRSPDPVTQAAAYRQHLLGLLGEDDPAEVQASTRAALLALLKDAGPDLRRTPAPDEWSVLELLGHLVDAEIVMSGRYRWVLSDDRPA